MFLFVPTSSQTLGLWGAHVLLSRPVGLRAVILTLSCTLEPPGSAEYYRCLGTTSPVKSFSLEVGPGILSRLGDCHLQVEGDGVRACIFTLPALGSQNWAGSAALQVITQDPPAWECALFPSLFCAHALSVPSESGPNSVHALQVIHRVVPAYRSCLATSHHTLLSQPHGHSLSFPI